MNTLIEKSELSISSMQYPYQRSVKGAINWEWRMNGIIGARGTGKTTLMLQKLKLLREAGHQVLYVRLDDFYFTDHRVYDLADLFRINGGEYLYLDEVHKYRGWARELKNIYDSMPGLKILFSGSSIIELTEQDADLSRRALLYELPGLSFREYLRLSDIIDMSAFGLEDLIVNSRDLSLEIAKKLPIIKHFNNYIESGYYPYFLEENRDYTATLEQVIKTVLETDLRQIENFDVVQLKKMLLLLKIISSSSPFKPNISAISSKAGLHRHTVLHYLHYLEKAKLIKTLNYPDKYISRLQKPDKIFLDNPNLFFVLNPDRVDKGSLRETFALSQLSVNHEVHLHEKADMMVDGKYIFEIGGKNKESNQIKGLENSFLLLDEIETAYHKRIPLWLMGFQY